MRKIIVILQMIIIAILAVLIFLNLDGNSKPETFIEPRSNSNSNKIIFMSDSQEPVWIEKFILDENHNLEARQLIFDKIIDEMPALVFHLGDLTAFGFWNREWKPVDDFIRQLSANNIEFYPLLGNHEVMFFPAKGRANFFVRFPFQSETGYSVREENIGIILLNSNFSNLTNAENEEQINWYQNRINKFENDKRIKFIIVAVHHSPFTNSKIVGTNEDVQKLFVPEFIKSQKAKLFISGHSHAFEHFKIEGKDFLVIGGAGGLQQPLYKGSEELFKDKFDSTSAKRMFHFIELENMNDSLIVNLKMLKNDFSKFEDKYRIVIKQD